MRLLLVRHGETTWNEAGRYQGWTDTSLSRRGEETARRIGKRLRERGVTKHALWASDLKRAVETARMAFGLQPLTDRRLRELDFGIFAGRTREENRRRFGDRFDAWVEHRGRPLPPGGETLEDFSARVAHWLAQVRRRTPPSGTVVAVTHGGVIRALVRPFVAQEHHPENGEITVLRWAESSSHPTVSRWSPDPVPT